MLEKKVLAAIVLLLLGIPVALGSHLGSITGRQIAASPDLAISEIAFTPDSPGQDSGVKIDITVQNKGTSEAASSVLQVEGAGTYWRMLTASISAGGSQKIQISPYLKQGEYAFKAVADADSAIAESDEANNAMTKQFTLGTPSTAASTGSLYVTAAQGAADLYVDNVFKGQTPITAGGLLAGSHSAVLKKSGYQDKTFTVEITAGQTLNIEAAMEAATTTPTGSPDLTIDSITPDKATEGNTPVTIVIRNSGTGSASSSVLSVGGAGSSWRLGVDSISAGSTKTLQVTPYLAAGEYKFKATADADSAVTELNENNNVGERTITVTAKSTATTPQQNATATTTSATTTGTTQPSTTQSGTTAQTGTRSTTTAAGGSATAQCTDTDGGKDYFVRGELKTATASGTTYHVDACWGALNNLLSEGYCDANNQGQYESKVECEFGCSQGACLSKEPKCEDTDPADDSNVKGYATLDGGITKIYDHCSKDEGLVGNDKSLTQISCDSRNRLKTSFIDCTEACRDGACIKAANATAPPNSPSDLTVTGISYKTEGNSITAEIGLYNYGKELAEYTLAVDFGDSGRRYTTSGRVPGGDRAAVKVDHTYSSQGKYTLSARLGSGSDTNKGNNYQEMEVNVGAATQEPQHCNSLGAESNFEEQRNCYCKDDEEKECGNEIEGIVQPGLGPGCRCTPKTQSFSIEIRKGWNLIAPFYMMMASENTCRPEDFYMHNYFPLERKYGQFHFSRGQSTGDSQNDEEIKELLPPGETDIESSEWFDVNVEGETDADTALYEKYGMLDSGYFAGTVANGWWMYADRDCDVNGETWLVPYIDALTDSGSKLAKGWNFISVFPDMAGRRIDEFKGSCQISKAYTFDSGRRKWRSAMNEELPEGLIGYGLVVKTSEECVLGFEREGPPPVPE
ncbi:PEGA domain-containing protein [Candidatus Woesearchaeota archaeon]|nr:PEGA domain-containing protein [Candidatus Woesearchaeota archaeon]